MKTYFSRITADHWCAKNNLHREINNVAKEMDRRIVTADEVEAFKAEISHEIEELNKKYSRCTPMKLSIHKDYDRGEDIQFVVSGVFQLVLFLAKNGTHGY